MVVILHVEHNPNTLFVAFKRLWNSFHKHFEISQNQSDKPHRFQLDCIFGNDVCETFIRSTWNIIVQNRKKFEINDV